MNNRTMYDAEGINAQRLKDAFPSAAMVAMYVTGSPDVIWTPERRALFPHATHVTIDQGFTGSPKMFANVRDVESGAWTAAKAVDRSGWKTARPTIYAGRYRLDQCISAGWRGDVWLSWPGWRGTVPPIFGGVRIVAVQNKFLGWYDESVVFDPYWPYNPPVEEHVQIITAETGKDGFATFPAGHYTHVVAYRDFVSVDQPCRIRVAVQYTNAQYDINEVNLTKPQPYEIPLAHPDAESVSVRLVSGLSPVTVSLW